MGLDSVPETFPQEILGLETKMVKDSRFCYQGEWIMPASALVIPCVAFLKPLYSQVTPGLQTSKGSPVLTGGGGVGGGSGLWPRSVVRPTWVGSLFLTLTTLSPANDLTCPSSSFLFRKTDRNSTSMTKSVCSPPHPTPDPGENRALHWPTLNFVLSRDFMQVAKPLGHLLDFP